MTSSLCAFSRKCLPDTSVGIINVCQSFFQVKMKCYGGKKAASSAPNAKHKMHMIFLKTLLYFACSRGSLCLLPISSHKIFFKMFTQQSRFNKTTHFIASSRTFSSTTDISFSSCKHVAVKNTMIANTVWCHYQQFCPLLLLHQQCKFQCSDILVLL